MIKLICVIRDGKLILFSFIEMETIGQHHFSTYTINDHPYLTRVFNYHFPPFTCQIMFREDNESHIVLWVVPVKWIKEAMKSV